MQIITPSEPSVDYTPFNALLTRWFSAQEAAKGLPAMNTAVADDPLESHRMIAKVTLEPMIVQYGQVGEALEALYGMPMQGKNLEELYNDWFRKRAYDGYRRCATECLPFYERRSFASAITKLGYYKLHLPYGTGKNTSHVFTYIVPMSPDIKVRADWERIVKLLPWF